MWEINYCTETLTDQISSQLADLPETNKEKARRKCTKQNSHHKDTNSCSCWNSVARYDESRNIARSAERIHISTLKTWKTSFLSIWGDISCPGFYTFGNFEKMYNL